MLNLEKKFEQFFRDRFNYLLILIIMLLLASPLLRLHQGGGIASVFFVLIFAALNIFILRIMIERPARFWAASVFFFSVCAFDLIAKNLGPGWSDGAVIFADVVYIVFLAIFLSHLFRALFNEKKVTHDSIKGGICIYLLLGIMWGVMYRILYFFDPGAFIFQDSTAINLFYFSYVTLTTVGYGDIVPTSRVAETLAFMEAVMGQVFLAVFIARLMGLHIAHVIGKKGEDRE
ncbi:MAG: potassium channel family protein [Candidatus Omnitrophota bacterium]